MFLTINKEIKHIVQLAMKLLEITVICIIIHRVTNSNVELREPVCRRVKRMVYRKIENEQNKP